MIDQMVQEAESTAVNTTFLNMGFHCFKVCVDNFRSNQLETNETKCARNCIEKYMKTFQRVQMRFMEQNSDMMVQGSGAPPPQ